jgi:hypothetical protein
MSERAGGGDYTHAIVGPRQYRDGLTGLFGQLFPLLREKEHP